jgi:hypothetical protein
MKITKIMAAAAIATIALLSSCNKEEKLGPAALNLDQVEVSFEAAASEKTVEFTSTRDWKTTVSSDAQDWLSVTPASGAGSNEPQTLTIQVLENTEYDRTATITVELLSGIYALDTKVITITQSGPQGSNTHEGTKESPYTPAEALAIINAGEATANEVFIAGIISQIDTKDPPGNTFGNATYWISEDGTTATQLMVYRGYGLGGEKMTTADYIKVGDEVIVAGVLILFKGNTPEVGQGSYIYSLNGTVKEKTGGGGGTDPEDQAGKEDDTKGTLESPYSIQMALYRAGLLDENGKEENVYIKGKVSSIESFSAEHSSLSYNLSDDGTAKSQLYVFGGKYFGGAGFTSLDQIKLGDEIVLYGTLVNYQGTKKEVTNGSIIITVNGKDEEGGGGGGETPEGTVITWTSHTDWTAVGSTGITYTFGDYTVSADKASGITAPFVSTASANDFRAYAKNTVTVSSASGNLTSIVFMLSAQGLKRLASITADSGAVAAQASGDTRVSWTGDAAKVVFTVGDTAIYGTENTKAGQLCCYQIIVK